MPIPVPRLTALASLVLAAAMAGPARAQSAPEPVVKAGFVYNFAKFTEWPASALAGPSIVLCLTGGDPQGAISSAIEGRPLQGRTLTVRRNVRPDDLRSCHIAYLTDTDERRQSEALRAIRGAPVLSIGDTEGFADIGGVIGLEPTNDRIQFEVNADAAQSAGLKISSQLLRLARAVKGRTP